MASSSSPYPDPASLPSDAIQRVLFIASTVHIYQIPPLTSNKGYTASLWTANNSARQIFTARLRIIETAIPYENESGSGESLSTEILLEDPSNGDLFAKAPYRDDKVVEPVLDSSRFFAVRIEGDGGQKVVLGIGFEERAEAIDFGICLQECRKVLGLEPQAKGKGTGVAEKAEVKKDYGLKEGQTIKIDMENIGRKGRRKAEDESFGGGGRSGEEKVALFSIKPPPAPPPYDEKGGGALPMLAPPPSAQKVRAEKRKSRGYDPAPAQEKKAADLGFDDGEFGEFQ